jgi:hypothetical protein
MSFRPEKHIREYAHGYEVPSTLLSSQYLINGKSYREFRPDVAQWMDDNVAQGWSMAQYFYGTSLGLEQAHIMSFEDEDDLIAFHMKWL